MKSTVGVIVDMPSLKYSFFFLKRFTSKLGKKIQFDLHRVLLHRWFKSTRTLCWVDICFRSHVRGSKSKDI